MIEIFLSINIFNIFYIMAYALIIRSHECQCQNLIYSHHLSCHVVFVPFSIYLHFYRHLGTSLTLICLYVKNEALWVLMVSILSFVLLVQWIEFLYLDNKYFLNLAIYLWYLLLCLFYSKLYELLALIIFLFSSLLF